jgi:hypothetical protein
MDFYEKGLKIARQAHIDQFGQESQDNDPYVEDFARVIAQALLEARTSESSLKPCWKTILDFIATLERSPDFKEVWTQLVCSTRLLKDVQTFDAISNVSEDVLNQISEASGRTMRIRLIIQALGIDIHGAIKFVETMFEDGGRGKLKERS